MTSDPLHWIDEELDALAARHLLRQRVTRIGPQSGTITLAWPSDEGGIAAQETAENHKTLINFSANDYLGLAGDPRLIDAAAEAGRQQGWGAGASPLVTGRSESHSELERRLAAFEGVEAALVFTSGFAANLGTVSALVEKGDAIYADAKNHASLIDGCRLSRAEIHVYRHCDVDHLAEMLRDSSSYRRRLIVTDSLFSMAQKRAFISAWGR
jgi:7-keto-8-aminopelargonate synthetase-like enzyme